MKLNFNPTFTKELPADKQLDNHRRQVVDACFSYVSPKKTAKPELIHYSDEMLLELGLSEKDAKSDKFLKVFTGNEVFEGTHPYAMCYGGHQFGNWAGQLGDGRAINLFEIEYNNKNWAVQLKGAGETPYSRRADGLAVLRSSIREYLCSEAMFHLNIPTTRALSLSLSGDEVLRDVMYDGNSAYEKGAVVCRVSESFVRFGNFEILAARQNTPVLKQLADYTISNFFKTIVSEGKQKYLDLLIAVRDNTIKMIVEWHRVGFVHGVMNTDNMSILGLTIDYGPYGWLDDCDYEFTPNTTDSENRRYRFGNQAYIGMTNLFKLANALYPLIEEVEPLQEVINDYQELYEQKFEQMMLKKLGLTKSKNTVDIISELEKVLHLMGIDYTMFFRKLGLISKTNSVVEILKILADTFYNIGDLKGQNLQKWELWINKYLELLKQESLTDEQRKNNMDLVNPKYIFRNYMAQLAIEAAEKGDYKLIDTFYKLLKNPYDEQPDCQEWFAKRPDWARSKVGCTMLSCSS